MSERYDDTDHWYRDFERENERWAEWLEARELERADTLAERGGQHKPLGSPTTAERSTALVKGVER